MPWIHLTAELERRAGAASPAARDRIAVALLVLTQEHRPDFVAVGKDEFEGYVAFGFDAIGTYVLESFDYGNATYVFGGEWERLSRLTKKEVIDRHLHVARIVHSKGWHQRMGSLLS